MIFSLNYLYSIKIINHFINLMLGIIIILEYQIYTYQCIHFIVYQIIILNAFHQLSKN